MKISPRDSVSQSPRLPVSSSPVSALRLARLRLRLDGAAREVALAVREAQIFFAQFGVDHFDLHLAEGSVLRTVEGRVGDEVLRAQLVLNLREGRAEVFLVAREVGAPARALADLAEASFVHAVEAEAVADADGVDDCVGLEGRVNGVGHALAAARVHAVGDEDDGAARLVRCLGEHLARRDPDGVPDGRGAGARVAVNRRRAYEHAPADVARRRLELDALDGAAHARGAASQALFERGVPGEGEHGHLVLLRAYDRVNELLRGALLFGERALLRGRGVNEDGERERSVGLALEGEDLLLDAVFEDSYVPLLERRDEALAPVNGGEEDVRQVGLDALHVILVNRLVRLRRPGLLRLRGGLLGGRLRRLVAGAARSARRVRLPLLRAPADREQKRRREHERQQAHETFLT